MNNEELKNRIGANIARLRRERGMTQAELAERLNYSDKAVSKWERAESTPDVLTLVLLARELGSDLNALVGTEEVSAPVPVETKEKNRIPKMNKVPYSKGMIQKLCTILVWFVALFLYVVLDAFGVKNAWFLFCWAVPANAIVLLSLRSAWKMFSWNEMLISVIVWGSLVCLHLLCWLTTGVNLWRIYLLGLVGQVAIILWFRMLRQHKKDQEEQNG